MSQSAISPDISLASKLGRLNLALALQVPRRQGVKDERDVGPREEPPQEHSQVLGDLHAIPAGVNTDIPPSSLNDDKSTPHTKWLPLQPCSKEKIEPVVQQNRDRNHAAV